MTTYLSRRGHSVGRMSLVPALGAFGLYVGKSVSIRALDSRDARMHPIDKIISGELNGADTTAATSTVEESEWEQWQRFHST